MYTPKNKALTPNTKEGEMKGALKKAADAAAAIKWEGPELRAQYMKGLADAQEAQETAARAKEDAETEAELDKACDDESRAREKERFFKKQLERLDFTPRMDEAEYYRLVDGVKTAVENAAGDFRAVAIKAMKDIMAAKATYMATAMEADNVLAALDNAANVLQSKHRYREVTFLNAPSRFYEDSYEWGRHATRYIATGKAGDLALKNGTEWDSMVCAAWRAAERAEGAERKGW